METVLGKTQPIDHIGAKKVADEVFTLAGASDSSTQQERVDRLREIRQEIITAVRLGVIDPKTAIGLYFGTPPVSPRGK